MEHFVDDAAGPEKVDASAQHERSQPLDQSILFEPRTIEDVGIESDEQAPFPLGRSIDEPRMASGADAEELRLARG